MAFVCVCVWVWVRTGGCVCVWGGAAFHGVHGGLETDQGKKCYDGMMMIMIMTVTNS
jgi:hypothetical protein